MNTVEVLKAARELISVPERWTQGAYARNVLDERVPENRYDASCWCAAGAICRVTNPNAPVAMGDSEAFRTINALLPKTCLVLHKFNDTHTHAEVLALFDKAIAAEEAK